MPLLADILILCVWGGLFVFFFFSINNETSSLTGVSCLDCKQVI